MNISFNLLICLKHTAPRRSGRPLKSSAAEVRETLIQKIQRGCQARTELMPKNVRSCCGEQNRTAIFFGSLSVNCVVYGFLAVSLLWTLQMSSFLNVGIPETALAWQASNHCTLDIKKHPFEVAVAVLCHRKCFWFPFREMYGKVQFPFKSKLLGVFFLSVADTYHEYSQIK